MSWRPAKSLIVLRDELNAIAPGRSKASDGLIGDASHQSRSSDHNPWLVAPDGSRVVTALDITHDPAGGMDCERLKDELVRSRDPRIKYIIWQGEIIAGAEGPKPWQPRPYRGPNKHRHHLHLSVEDDGGLYDVTEPWGLDIPAPPVGMPRVPKQPPLRLGDSGPAVRDLQAALIDAGFGPLELDSEFGPRTDRAVRNFQRDKGLVVDGVAGPATFDELDG
jgi:hypothetical protein